MFRWGIAFKGCMVCHRCRMMKRSHANMVGGVGNGVGNNMVYRLYRVGPMFMDKMV